MRVKTLVLAGLVLWGWSTVSVFAQELQLLPKNNLAVLIDTLPQGAAYCLVDESSLDAAVRLPLERYGFRANSSLLDATGFLYVSTSLLQFQSEASNRPFECAIHVSLELKRTVRIPSGTLIYDASVWRKGFLLTGMPRDMGREVRNGVEELTEEWIAKWLIDNPQ
jgi:hypothetical protein